MARGSVSCGLSGLSHGFAYAAGFLLIWSPLQADDADFIHAGRVHPPRLFLLSESRSPLPGATPPPLGDLPLSKRSEQMADALSSYAEGLIAEDDADTERALQAYRKTLSIDTSHTELAVKVALELTRRNDAAAGIDILKDAVKAAPNDPLPLLCLSQIYATALKKMALAERYAQQALALAPDRFGPYLALAGLYTELKQPKKAEAILAKAAKTNISDPDFWLQLAEARLRLAVQNDRSITSEECAIVHRALEKALPGINGNTEMQLHAADLYAVSQGVDQAIALYRKVIAENDVPADEALLPVREKLIRLYLASQQREAAIAELQSQIRDFPTRVEAYETLAELFASGNAAEKEVAKAIPLYQQTVLIEPSRIERHLRLAELQLQAHTPAAALQTLQEARTRFPADARASYLLAIALGRNQERQKALAAFAETVEEATVSAPQLLSAAFYFQYGVAAEQAGDLERAAGLLQKSIELDPENAAACNYLGYLWVDHGIRLTEAGELLKRAVALAPEEGAYLDSLGWYHYKTGNLTEALALLEKAFKQTEPEDATVDEHLGDVHAALGHVEKAREYWQKALLLNPIAPGLAQKINASGN